MATPTGYDAICFKVVVSGGTTGGGGGGGVFFSLQEINPMIKINWRKNTRFLIIHLFILKIHAFYQAWLPYIKLILRNCLVLILKQG
jgi:hypothetical protein